MAIKKTKNVVVGITASIAAYKACDVVNWLTKNGFCVSVIMTKDARNFVTDLTFQTLSANPVYSDMFKPVDKWNNLHVSLAKNADIVVVVPATADIIAKVASGICDDLLSCTICATKAKVLFAPAMNSNMYENKIVQSNIDKLKNFGYLFVGPKKGRLTCGDVGIGHIEDTSVIVDSIVRNTR